MAIGNRTEGRGSLQDIAYLQQYSFSSIQRHTIPGSGGILNVIWDPTAYTGRSIEFNAVKFIANGGPMLIDYFVGTVESGDGTPQIVINRVTTNLTPAQSTLTINPTTITSPGFNYFSTLVPGNQQAGSDSSVGLPVRVDFTQKYLLQITNQSSQAELMVVDATWFEILV